LGGHTDVNFTFDASVNSAPAAFKTDLAQVAQFYENNFTDPVTINLNINFGNTGLFPYGFFFATPSFTYAQVKTALAADAKSADDLAAVNSLPSNDPTGGDGVPMTRAEAKALGLIPSDNTIDATLTLSSTAAYAYNPSQRAVPGKLDFIGVAESAIGLALGRLSDAGSSFFAPLDLFRYGAPGSLQHARVPAYFSIDGGNTNLNNFFPGSTSGLPSDWAASAGNDAFDAAPPTGVQLGFSQTDLREMDILGYDLRNPTQPPGGGLPFNLVGFGEVGGDTLADLIWERGSDNRVFLEFQNGNAAVGGGFIANSPFDSSFRVVASGDFNGDGMTDLVYRRTGDGLTEIQFLNGTNGAGGGVIPNNPFDNSFNIVARGDFDGDGDGDLVWQRSSDGLTEIQFLNGNNGVGGGAIANNPFDKSFSIVGHGDFNGDGNADLVWRRPSDGLTEIQFLNGNNGAGGGVIANNPFGADFQIVTAGDFNGDGHADLVWRRPADGLVEIQFLNGNNGAGGGVIANSPFVSTDWQVVGVGHFNGDGKADLVYRSVSTGLTEIQMLNGITPIGGGVTGDGFLPSPGTINLLLHAPAIM
jgi:hypothetical protein